MHVTWESLFFTVVTGLLNASIIAFLGVLIRRSLRSRPRKQVLHWLLLAIASISGFVAMYQTYAIMLGHRTEATPITKHVVVLLALLVHWAAGFLVYFITRVQYGGKSDVCSGDETIQVRFLYAPPVGRKLELTWETVSVGVRDLIVQVDQLARGGANFCVGINNAGAAIASFLAGVQGRHNPLPVYVAIAKGTHRNLGSLSEQLPSVTDPTILVADMQFRTGRSVKEVVDLLTRKYGDKARILIAVLVVVEDGRPINKMRGLLKSEGLKACFQQKPDYLPDYVAFISGASVRFPRLCQ